MLSRDFCPPQQYNAVATLILQPVEEVAQALLSCRLTPPQSHPDPPLPSPLPTANFTPSHHTPPHPTSSHPNSFSNPHHSMAYYTPPHHATLLYYGQALFFRGAPHLLPLSALALCACFWFFLSALAATLALPVGLLVPMMVVGGSLGRLLAALFLEDAYNQQVISRSSASNQPSPFLEGTYDQQVVRSEAVRAVSSDQSVVSCE